MNCVQKQQQKNSQNKINKKSEKRKVFFSSKQKRKLNYSMRRCIRRPNNIHVQIVQLKQAHTHTHTLYLYMYMHRKTI